MQDIEVIKADLKLSRHQDAVVSMIDAYAMDPMGDGKQLDIDVRDNLIPGLRDLPTTLIFLALGNGEPLGIAVCFRGFSTFAAKPLINIHDLYVAQKIRGRGLGRLLLEHVEQEANATGCCKLTLEVLENNRRARQIYNSFGFAQAVYVQEAGGALFMAKSLSNGAA